MGTLTVTEFITLDGVAQAPGHPDEDTENGFRFGGWQAPLESPENDGVVFEEAQRTDALLLGRKTYDIFAGYWPFAPEEIPFTGFLNPGRSTLRAGPSPSLCRGRTHSSYPVTWQRASAG